MNLETEIRQETNLCDKSGNLNLNAVGWSKKPIHRCNLSGKYLRKKKWNYWCIYDENFLVSFTISNVDYAGVIFVYWLDRKTGNFEEGTVLTPFGSGVNLGQLVVSNATYIGKNARLQFFREEEGYRLSVNFSLKNKIPIQAEIEVPVSETWETLNVVVPWSKRKFQFTEKLFGVGARGFVRYGAMEYKFEPKSSFACMDYGRGVWPYSTKWNWASMVSHNAEYTIGINLGAGWTDGTGTTENAILINGRIYKIPSDAVFEMDRENWMKPWRLYTKDSQAIDLRFLPEFHRKASTNVGIFASSVHQMIGKFEGVIRLGKNEYKIANGQGWAEDHVARW
ncbi:DUF2804 domain-containing protein [Leptospira kirschneri]|uniref:PF10974 family protein n=1 Tax=Leptospira kirschneri serovar Bulgarica str. Nikolaevo TaxID=1240687 RepID=M6F9R1_9LEPT|nr:DUF2804 domain-containing protein [Leptospira kirschneri]EMK23787.1 PF10974 family protein [Leptospira kirschneri serovar Bulgarica str. Nikolaevo]